MKHPFHHRTKSRQYATGDQVLGKDFSSLEKWQPAEVLQHTEHSTHPHPQPHLYSVQLKDRSVWTYHVGHLIKGAPTFDGKEDVEPNPDTNCQAPVRFSVPICVGR